MGSEWEVCLRGGGPSYSELLGKNGDREHVGMKVVGLEAERRPWCLRQLGLGGGGPCYSEWMSEDGVGKEVGMKVVGLEAERRAWCLRQCRGTPMQIGCQEECCRW